MTHLGIEEDHLGQVGAAAEGSGAHHSERGLHEDDVCGMWWDVQWDGGEPLIRAEHLPYEAVTALGAGQGGPGQEQEAGPAQPGSGWHLLHPTGKEKQKRHLHRGQAAQ